MKNPVNVVRQHIKNNPAPYLAASAAVGCVTGVVITAKYYSAAGFVKDAFTADQWVSELWAQGVVLVSLPADQLESYFGNAIDTAVAGQL